MVSFDLTRNVEQKPALVSALVTAPAQAKSLVMPLPGPIINCITGTAPTVGEQSQSFFITPVDEVELAASGLVGVELSQLEQEITARVLNNEDTAVRVSTDSSHPDADAVWVTVAMSNTAPEVR